MYSKTQSVIEIYLYIFHIMDLYFPYLEYKYTYSQMVCVHAFLSSWLVWGDSTIFLLKSVYFEFILCQIFLETWSPRTAVVIQGKQDSGHLQCVFQQCLYLASSCVLPDTRLF